MKDSKCTLDKLFDMFRIHGAKTLTMDDIAKAFSMSKKTLYQKYRNKEEMLLGVLNHVSDKAMQQIYILKNQYDCPIEILLIYDEKINEVIGDEKSAFILQLAKYYPEILQEHQKINNSKILELLNQNFESGLEKGYFRSDINKEIYLKFVLSLFFSVKTSPIFENLYQDKRVQNEIVKFYLDAIVTEKGKQRLKELNTKYEELD